MEVKTKVLILGGGILQSHCIMTAVRQGIECHVLDGNAHCWASMYEPIVFEHLNFSNVEAVDAYVKKVGSFSAVVAPVVEVGNRVAAELAYRHGFRYNSREAVANTTNKYLMRKAMQRGGVKGPNFVLFENIEQVEYEVGYPCVLKPTKAASSKGVRLVRNRKEFLSCLPETQQYANSQGEVLVESCLPSCPQYSIETLSFEGRHYVVGIVRENQSPAPYFIERNNVIDPKENRRLYPLAQQFVEQLLPAMGVTVGACHIEARYDGEQFWLVELGSRVGGFRDFMFRYAEGVDYVQLFLRSYLGEKVDLGRAEDYLPKRAVLCAIPLTEKDFVLYRKAQAAGVVVESHVHEECLSQNPQSLADTCGFYFVVGKDEKSLSEFYLPLDFLG